jgi:hypothetical protein
MAETMALPTAAGLLARLTTTSLRIARNGRCKRFHAFLMLLGAFWELTVLWTREPSGDLQILRGSFSEPDGSPEVLRLTWPDDG